MLQEIKRFLVGRPLSNQEIAHTRVRKTKALAVLASDALSSTAYATEEILLALVSFGAIATIWALPISLSILGLMLIVGLSYSQTIEYYPNGGGAYMVAKDNLGERMGLIAGSALLIDYVLTVSVSVAAGMSAVVSAFPSLLPFKVILSIITVIIISILNLRGLRESATIFAFPTYVFVFAIFSLLIGGFWKLSADPTPIIENLGVHESFPWIPVFFILKAFSSGCTAMTGIEAISNGVPIFQEPAARNAKKTLLAMITILASLFIGLTLLAKGFHVVPHDNETVVSQIARKVFGPSFFYYLVQFSTMMILVLAANTSYTGFPGVTSLIAKDRYLPRQFAALGDRLVFSNSIFGLAIASIIVLILFNADTHAIIPLYAVGVFLSFTLSQAGMVKFHLKTKHPGWRSSMIINSLGSLTTFIVMLVIASTKFSHGAWIVVLLIPFFVWVFYKIHSHYLQVGEELSLSSIKSPKKLERLKHTVIVPISGMHRGVLEALRYAVSISEDVRACYVEIDSLQTERVRDEWKNWAPEVPFVVLKSPYRSVIRPILEYIDDIDKSSPHSLVTVIIPEFVTAKWWHSLLHNQTAFIIRTALLFKRRKVVTSVRYHLKNT